MPDTEQPQSPRGLAGLRLFLWIAVGVGALLGLALLLDRGGTADGAASAYANSIGGPFTLTAPDGSTVTEKTLAGKPYAIFFGFTRCPDVCPTSLARMAALRKRLGANGMKFNIVFVSVDPEHDKPADLGNYVALFGTPIMGLTGTEAQIAAIKKEYGVYSAKVPQPGGDYTIDHTAAIYLMTSQGRFSGTIDHQESEDTALEKLKRLVA